jgi:hypothetical protein
MENGFVPLVLLMLKSLQKNLNWYPFTTDTSKRYEKWTFGRTNEFSRLFKFHMEDEEDIRMENGEGVYYVTGEGDSLITLINTVDNFKTPLQRVDWHYRRKIHYFNADTLIVKTAHFNSVQGRVTMYFYDYFIRQHK